MSSFDHDPVKELFDRERDQIVSYHGNDLHWQGIVRRARAQRRSRFLGYAAGMTAAGLVIVGVTYGAFLHNGTTLLPAAGPVPACGAQLPLDAPHLTAADAKMAVGTAVPTCEVVDTGAGRQSYRPSSLSSAQTREPQWINWLPFDGGALPPGCVLSLQKRAFVQIDGRWYEARNVGCGSNLPLTAS